MARLCLVYPAGELRAHQGRRGIPKGEETVGFRPSFGSALFRPPTAAPDAALSIVLSAPPYSSSRWPPPSPHGSPPPAPASAADSWRHSEESAPPACGLEFLVEALQ